MQQIDQREYGLITQQGQNGQIIQVGERVYQLTELPVHPSPYRPQPAFIHPTTLPQQESFWHSWPMVVLLGSSLLILAGFGTFLVVKAALPPVPVPTAVSPAPAPPAPVIIQAPPPPPPQQPFTEKDCKPSGFLGMQEACTTRQGYR